ncbi:hypothetical protein PAXRUDRAFT_835511 [Paxillus rubicundulus Ve08.2h10]|uniref:Uncharacterized protein n=1 Tax=Paxillus rubicundulus Ve08.2h10 TaxID=930991 RepID=A0A0D0CL90_9AGAM|nr:hypothetical protein PAXRUDRAFT_835511 [Paxillus rubicundulus Ve08.2h10]
MTGFTRTLYSDGYRYTMRYPSGWTPADHRRPVVHKEVIPTELPPPPRVSVAPEQQKLEQQPTEIFDLPPRHPRRTAAVLGPSNGNATPAPRQTTQNWSFPLKSYLSNAWLPQYTLGSRIDMNARQEWPYLPDLVLPPGTRALQAIRRIEEIHLRKSLLAWKHSLPDFQITSTLLEEGKLADLALADTQSSSLDENDFRFLEFSDLNFVTDVTKLLAAFPLRTALKAFKIFAGVPEEHEVNKLLRFKDVNNLCAVRGDRFDLLALPGEKATDLSLLVVVVPPWDIRFDDLNEFVREGIPTGGSLDLGPSAPSPHAVLWALIWDICWEHNCRFFVLSNYDQWVFGNFSNDMRHAQVTTYMRAPVFPKEQNVRADDISDPKFPVPNVIECLLYWIAAAVDPNYEVFGLPPNIPDPRRGWS